MRFSTCVQRRMKCSALSRFGGWVVGPEVGALDTGGSATESLPPHADSTSSGAVSAPARMRRTPIEAVPPETAADVPVTVLTSRRLGKQVVDGQGIDVVVVGQVDHLEPGAGGPAGVVQRSRPRAVGGIGPAAAGPRPEEREPAVVVDQTLQHPGDRLGITVLR